MDFLAGLLVGIIAMAIGEFFVFRNNRKKLNAKLDAKLDAKLASINDIVDKLKKG